MKNIKILVDDILITYNKKTDAIEITKNPEANPTETTQFGDSDNIFLPPNDSRGNPDNMIPHDSKRGAI